MPPRPKVSIVTVTFNDSTRLKRALESVNSQTYKSLEHVIVDGGSTDETASTVAKLGHRVSSFESRPDEGIYDAMNQALGLAKGDIIHFLNSDDRFAGTDSVERMVLRMEETGTAITYGDVLVGFANGTGSRRLVQCAGAREFRRGKKLVHQAFMARKALFDKIGAFDLKYRIAADFDWECRALLLGARFSKINQPAVWFELGGASSRALATTYRETAHIIKKYFGARYQFRYGASRMPRLLVAKALGVERAQRIRYHVNGPH